jgi:hypothetical protein
VLLARCCRLTTKPRSRPSSLTADYLDCWLNRRLWNFKSIDYSTLQYATFLLTKELRNLSLDALRDKLITRLTNDEKEPRSTISLAEQLERQEPASPVGSLYALAGRAKRTARAVS